MSRIVDRRKSKHSSALNRDRFIRRFKKQIREAVQRSISSRSIEKVDEKGETVNIPTRDTNEPNFHYGKGGVRRAILPGNEEFTAGDSIPRPPEGGGQGQGSQASDSGEGNDDFVFQLSREEFLEVFFEDLALPNLVKTKLKKITSEKLVRAGFTTSGVPTNINVLRSMKGAMGRRMALKAPLRGKMKALEAEREEKLKQHAPSDPVILALDDEIASLQRRIQVVPFIDPIDLRYNHRVKRPQPTTQAVMFCLMDVSGSMDETKKDIAKRFFILLYLFLSKSYENVELVFIRHHTSAKEVTEEEFFYSRETGGTVVSSALDLMKMIIQARYSTDEWNIYGAQASDGDNWNNDSPKCHDILCSEIMPYVQYFAYVEILPRHHQSLWEAYETVSQKFENFAMQNIDNAQDIYPVFRELFKRETA